MAEKKRSALGLEDRRVRPFTTREGIQLGGLSRQISQPNFVHELIDLRLMVSRSIALRTLNYV